MKNFLFLVFAFCIAQVVSAQEAASVSTVRKADVGVYDKNPEFPGGLTKFYISIVKNLPAPRIEGITNKIYISFTVETDGSMSDIKILGVVPENFEKKLLKAMAKCSKWIPAEKNGIKVSFPIQFPITAY
ncbi:MAG: protein TonB [Aureispira sp.]|jgi:protein TonB